MFIFGLNMFHLFFLIMSGMIFVWKDFQGLYQTVVSLTVSDMIVVLTMMITLKVKFESKMKTILDDVLEEEEHQNLNNDSE